jgi:hypothetical protein
LVVSRTKRSNMHALSRRSPCRTIKRIKAPRDRTGTAPTLAIRGYPQYLQLLHAKTEYMACLKAPCSRSDSGLRGEGIAGRTS